MQVTIAFDHILPSLVCRLHLGELKGWNPLGEYLVCRLHLVSLPSFIGFSNGTFWSVLSFNRHRRRKIKAVQMRLSVPKRQRNWKWKRRGRESVRFSFWTILTKFIYSFSGSCCSTIWHSLYLVLLSPKKKNMPRKKRRRLEAAREMLEDESQTADIEQVCMCLLTCMWAPTDMQICCNNFRQRACM